MLALRAVMPALVIVSCAASIAGAQAFTMQSFPASAGAHVVTVGDVNRDGYLDLVVGSDVFAGATFPVTVLLGNGTGAFTVVSNLPGVLTAASVALADLNRDQRLDLVVSHANPKILQIHLGDASGSFYPSGVVTTAFSPGRVLLTDITGDARVDALVSYPGQPFVGVHAGDGLGGFGAAVTTLVGSLVTDFAVAPVNGDSIPDLVVASGPGGRISVLPGLGNGSFGAPIHSFTGASPTSFALADLDGDGRIDVVSTSLLASTLRVQLGQGNGVFGPAVEVPTLVGLIPSQVSIADLTGDGRPDVVVGSPTFGDLGLLTNLGGGVLGPAQATSSAAGGGRPVVADVDHDGVNDLVLPNLLLGTVMVKTNPLAVPAGVSFLGKGTPGCMGGVRLFASGTPLVGDASFAILGTNGPRYALGLGIVTSIASDLGGDPFSIGAILYVDLFASLEVVAFDVWTDSTGAAAIPVPIPANAQLAGQSYYAQVLYAEPLHQTCSTSVFGLLSSDAMKLSIP